MKWMTTEQKDRFLNRAAFVLLLVYVFLWVVTGCSESFTSRTTSSTDGGESDATAAVDASGTREASAIASDSGSDARARAGSKPEAGTPVSASDATTEPETGVPASDSSVDATSSGGTAGAGGATSSGGASSGGTTSSGGALGAGGKTLVGCYPGNLGPCAVLSCAMGPCCFQGAVCGCLYPVGCVGP
jgi:hypothetical protein